MYPEAGEWLRLVIYRLCLLLLHNIITDVEGLHDSSYDRGSLEANVGTNSKKNQNT
jgi:hypothetical protein